MTITYHPLVYPAGGDDPRDAAQELADRTRGAIAGAIQPRWGA